MHLISSYFDYIYARFIIIIAYFHVLGFRISMDDQVNEKLGKKGIKIKKKDQIDTNEVDLRFINMEPRLEGAKFEGYIQNLGPKNFKTRFEATEVRLYPEPRFAKVGT